MALGTFVAGRYSSTYDGVAVGITRDGYELQLDSEQEDIGETDMYGLSVIDSIWRGGNAHIQFTATEYKAGSLAAFWPFGGSLSSAGVVGILVDDSLTTPNKVPIATLASVLASPFVLTSTVDTSAVASPATLTATYALLAKNNNGKLLYNSKLREVPVRLRLYPYVASSITRWFSTT